MTTAETDQTKKRNGADWRSVDIVFADGSTGPAKAAYVGDGWCDVLVEDNGARLWVRANGEVDLSMNPCRLAKPWAAGDGANATAGVTRPWTPESWNTCPKCKHPVEKAGGDIFDGDEVRCVGCKTVFVASFAEDGGPGSLCEPEQCDALSPENKAVEDTDPFTGLPEEERARILDIADKAGRMFGLDAERMAIAREVAAYHARRVPEMLNREEAEKRLRALGVGEKTISEDLDNPRDVIVCYDTASVAPKYAAEVASRVAVLRAHVRWLDAQRDASPSPRRPVATNAETGLLATVPANERARIIAVAQKASRDNPFDCDRAYRDVVAREVAAWHARPPCVPCSGKGGLPGRWKCGVCGGTGRTIPAFDGVPGANPYGGKRPPASVRIEYDHGPDGETYRIEVPATPVPIGIARRGAPERVTDDELSAYAGQPGNISKADGPELAARLAAEVVALRAEHNAAHVRLDKAGALTHMIGTGTDEDQRATLTERIHDLATTVHGAQLAPLTPEQLRAIVDDLAEAGDSRTVLVSAATVRALLGAHLAPARRPWTVLNEAPHLTDLEPRKWPASDASPEARAEGAWLAWDGALPGALLFAWDDFHPAAKAAWHAVVNYCDASRPTAPERAFPRVTIGSVAPGSLVENAGGFIALALAQEGRRHRRLLWVDTGMIGDMHEGATVSLRATPAELDALTSADGASRPTLTAEDRAPRGEQQAREIDRLTAELAARDAAAAGLWGSTPLERGFDFVARTLAGALAEIGETPEPQVDKLAEQAARVIRGRAPADASLEARAEEEPPWNWCPRCKQTVDDDMRTGEFRDGSEGTCLGCGTVYVAVAYSDDHWALVSREENDWDASRHALTEEQARELAREAILGANGGCAIVDRVAAGYLRASRGETGPDAERGSCTEPAEEQLANLRERAAFIAETCSGGDHIISKRDLIAQRIRELPLRAAAHADDDESSAPAMRHLFIARHGDSPTEPVPPMCPTPEPQSPDGALARADAYARLSALGLDAYSIVQMLDNAAQYLAGECGTIREDARAVLLAYVRGLPRVSKAPPARTIPEPTSARPKRLVHIVDHEGTVEHGVAHVYDPDAGTWSTPRSETVPGLCDCYASTPGLSVTARDWHAKTCPEYIRRAALSEASTIETQHDPIGLGEPFPVPMPDIFQGSPPSCPVPMPNLAPTPPDEEKR